jgi:hypothetical protein
MNQKKKKNVVNSYSMVVGAPSAFSGGSPQFVFGNDQTHLLPVGKGSKIKAALKFLFGIVVVIMV